MKKVLRRSDRAMAEEKTQQLLDSAEYGVMSMSSLDGQPYAVPLSYVIYEGFLYFHCALEGKKLDIAAANPHVVFTVVGPTEPVYDGKGFSTYYESAMFFGRLEEVGEIAEKYAALKALCEKYLPQSMDKFEESMAHSERITRVFKIIPEHITGKHKVKPQ